MRREDKDAQQRLNAYKQRAMDYRETFASEAGKRVLNDLATKGRESAATFVAENQYLTAYREGMRAVIIHIRAMLERDPFEVKQETVKD